MLQWDKPVFDPPFELWRSEGVLHLTITAGRRLELAHMKELIRLVAALDGSGRAPVLMECRENVQFAEEARALLLRACGAQGHPVAFFTLDLDCRLQGEVFKRVQRPAFPFRVFAWRDEACRWVRERQQAAGLLQQDSRC